MYVVSHKKRRTSPIFAILGVILYSYSVFSDARTEYLVKMLDTSDNYRLRVQAATTLGKLREKSATPNLVKALRDRNELVVISAAIALKQIGDPAVIGAVEAALTASPSSAAKSQLKLTIKTLRDVGGKSKKLAKNSSVPRFLVRVDAMGNSSAMRDSYLTQMMKKIVVERIGDESDVILQSEKMNGKKVLAKKKSEKLEAYIISGAILKLNKEKGRLTVKLGLNLFSNPEYSLLMMPTSEAAISVDDVQFGEKKAKEIERAIKIVSDSLVNSIFNTLRQSMTN